MSFGQRVAYIRDREGIKQKELAEKLGIKSRRLSDYEREINRPSDEMMVAIARELDISMDYLMGLSDDIVSFDRKEVILIPRGMTHDNISKVKEYMALLYNQQK